MLWILQSVVAHARLLRSKLTYSRRQASGQHMAPKLHLFNSRRSLPADKSNRRGKPEWPASTPTRTSLLCRLRPRRRARLPPPTAPFPQHLHNPNRAKRRAGQRQPPNVRYNDVFTISGKLPVHPSLVLCKDWVAFRAGPLARCEWAAVASLVRFDGGHRPREVVPL